MSIHIYDSDRRVIDTENGRSIVVPETVTNEPSTILELDSVTAWAKSAGFISDEDLLACA